MKYKMKKIALICEIIAAISIIISLIFVGIQFRENTIATRSATANSISAMTVAWYTETGNSEQSSQLMWNYLKDPSSLKSNAEIFQATMVLHGLILAFQNSYYLVNQGTLDKDVQESLTAAISAVKDQPGWDYFWENRKSLFLTDFRNYIEELMRSESEVDEGIYSNSNNSIFKFFPDTTANISN